jgi:hypothetical protein
MLALGPDRVDINRHARHPSGSCRPQPFDASAHDLKQNRKEIAMSDMTIEEMEQRIESLQNSGMHLAAKALMRELNYRRKAG